MASDSNWVEDVRRWVSASRPQAGPDIAEPEWEVGYEAANPSLQAAYWPDTQAMFKDVPS